MLKFFIVFLCLYCLSLSFTYLTKFVKSISSCFSNDLSLALFTNLPAMKVIFLFLPKFGVFAFETFSSSLTSREVLLIRLSNLLMTYSSMLDSLCYLSDKILFSFCHFSIVSFIMASCFGLGLRGLVSFSNYLNLDGEMLNVLLLWIPFLVTTSLRWLQSQQ